MARDFCKPYFQSLQQDSIKFERETLFQKYSTLDTESIKI